MSAWPPEHRRGRGFLADVARLMWWFVLADVVWLGATAASDPLFLDTVTAVALAFGCANTLGRTLRDRDIGVLETMHVWRFATIGSAFGLVLSCVALARVGDPSCARVLGTVVFIMGASSVAHRYFRCESREIRAGRDGGSDEH